MGNRSRDPTLQNCTIKKQNKKIKFGWKGYHDIRRAIQRELNLNFSNAVGLAYKHFVEYNKFWAMFIYTDLFDTFQIKHYILKHDSIK
jgi:hypothetical protein